MPATAASHSAQVPKTLGHAALHYRQPHEGPLAAKLLETIGFTKSEELQLPNGSHFYRFYVDAAGPNNGDGILYLSPLPESNRQVIEAARAALRVGQPDQHPSVAAYHAAQGADPEHDFHVGVLLKSLEELEATMLRVQELERSDPRFKGRIVTLVNRARPGTPEVDQRMDASPIYAKVTRYTYGRNGVQAFIKSDLLATGPLGEGQVIELDYVFPGYPKNLFTTTEV